MTAFADRHPRGYFIASRENDGIELVKMNNHAMCLLYVIAQRAQRTNAFNPYSLSPGQALIGDYRAVGMSEREYRTAKALLERHGFATFKATNKGTVATLTSTSIFDINAERSDGQTDTQTTGKRRADDRQTTDKRRAGDDYQQGNKENKGKTKQENKAEGAAPPAEQHPAWIPDDDSAWDWFCPQVEGQDEFFFWYGEADSGRVITAPRDILEWLDEAQKIGFGHIVPDAWVLEAVAVWWAYEVMFRWELPRTVGNCPTWQAVLRHHAQNPDGHAPDDPRLGLTLTRRCLAVDRNDLWNEELRFKLRRYVAGTYGGPEEDSKLTLQLFTEAGLEMKAA